MLNNSTHSYADFHQPKPKFLQTINLSELFSLYTEKISFILEQPSLYGAHKRNRKDLEKGNSIRCLMATWLSVKVSFVLEKVILSVNCVKFARKTDTKYHQENSVFCYLIIMFIYRNFTVKFYGASL